MDQKNFIVAIVLSVLIIVGWQAAFPPAKPPVNGTPQQTATQSGAPAAPTGQPGAPGTQPGPGAAPAQQPVVSRSAAVALTPRVTFNTAELTGSISLKGARIDDVQLVKYRETIDPKSPPVPVLSPVGSKNPYYAEFGWSSSDAAIKVPGPETVWTSDSPTVAPGKPVKLIYTREDDMAAGFYRPASVAKFEAALDAKGQPTMLKCGVGSPSIMAASGFMEIPDSGVDAMAMEGIADHPYDIANQRLSYGRAEPGPQVWFWRSVGHSQNIFFIESFIDELAAAAKADPFEYRRALLSKQPRYKGVLELAAQKAGWGTPPPKGVFRGIAVAQSFGSYVAEVVEVSIAADGTPKLHRVVAAVDCGMTVNPQTIERQIEGGIVYGLSAALYGEITLANGAVEQANFSDYDAVRLADAPEMAVHLVDSGSQIIGGVGEPGTPPIAPAVANAIFAVTGKRLRDLPLRLV